MEKPLAYNSYYDFIVNHHDLYTRYEDDWRLAVKSYYGGVEYRRGNYLKAYDIDYSTPSEVINTYDIDDNGNQTGKYSTYAKVNSRNDAEYGTQYLSNFYAEKISSVPVFPYTRLYVSEYNSILWSTPPTRVLPEKPEVEEFLMDVNGEGLSCNEFWSQVDTFTTVYGVVWLSCVKPVGRDYALWHMHNPLDVTNWSYSYDANGELVLKKIVIKIAENDEVCVYRYFTPETIDTIFVPYDEDADIDLPEEAEFFENEEKGYYRISQENELGYIPVRPVYQSSKIYNGVGHTPVFDIAQIQRSIYSDMGEIYSAVSYGSHGVCVVDEETANLNDGAISAEPGSIIRVASALNGQPNHTFEFVAPPLDSIAELRQLIDQKIDKMNAVAMIRSEDLIRASRSGTQIEQYDAKLEAFIRKKAVSLENAEYHMWKIWFDWLETSIPEDFSVSYNRVFSKKGIEQEINELQHLMNLVTDYKSKFGGEQTYTVEQYSTQEQAEARARELGGSGFHSHDEDGTTIYMPFQTHGEYEMAMQRLNPRVDLEEDTGFEEEMKESLQERMMQLINSTYSKNSL